MHKKTRIFICLLFIFIFFISFQITYAKYVIENIYVVAKLDIDRCKPLIEVTYIATSNTCSIAGHIKITEKNIVRNNLSPDNIKVILDNHLITPKFKNFSLISESTTEKTYKFSFDYDGDNASLEIIIPEGIVEDASGLTNEETYFSTDISNNHP